MSRDLDETPRAKGRILVCACGARWPWERFKTPTLPDCPECDPKAWGLAISLVGPKPLPASR